MLARLRNDERGQILPALFLVAIVTVAGSLMLFQLGRATTMSARAQTGADAAALAAADNIRLQLIGTLAIYPYGEYKPELVSGAGACGFAAAYAADNGTVLSPAGCRWYPQTWSVRVRVSTMETLDGRYGLPETRGRSANARAHAHVTPKSELVGPPLRVRLRRW